MSYPTSEYKLTPSGLYNGSTFLLGKTSNNLNLLPANPNNISTGFQKLANFDFAQNGMYLLNIRWAGGYNTSGSTIYWGTDAVAVITLRDVNGNYYNASPTTAVDALWTHHHRNVNLPTLQLDSDSTNGNYGDLCLYINFPQITRISGMTVTIQQLFIY